MPHARRAGGKGRLGGLAEELQGCGRWEVVVGLVQLVANPSHAQSIACLFGRGDLGGTCQGVILMRSESSGPWASGAGPFREEMDA